MTGPAGGGRDPGDPGGVARIRPYLGVEAGPDGEPEPPPDGLRPFVLTAGRVTGADSDIGLETQVTARTGAPPYGLARELRTIVALCATPVSVAEISARSGLHLGVTRILVGDLRAAGYLDVHAHDLRPADPDIILRVIRGLRAIS
ncbi:DUF742 domain-containing protein [Rhizomonospora bruguierae]|uniref:DUF742 domain-containing protein n=1 Tax=Rhizomonospora bruguierae TaxID=1581705 RepID=UPI001BCB3F30|nr:DUF742 domain-containing protein [Micromonospora sp. NBRC 107566]